MALPTPSWCCPPPRGDYVVADALPTLVYLANLAALELRIPQWTVGSAGPDRLIVDLDPGSPGGPGLADIP